MKILKRILLGFVVLVAILFIIPLFTNNKVAVERHVTVGRSAGEVFNYIKYLRNQDGFSKWANMDPAMKKEYRGTDGTVGFVSTWDSEEVGKGEQTIVRINEGEAIDSKLHFVKPFEGFADARMVTVPVSPNETKVKWSYRSEVAYPMNLMLLFVDMDKMMGDDLQTGLNNLKQKLETSSM